MNYWNNKKVIVTGGAGFLGNYVVKELKYRGCEDIVIPRSIKYNLTLEEDVERLFEYSYDEHKNIIVIHLAAQVGGIGANQKYPGELIYNNLMLNTLIVDVACRWKVDKLVAVGSVCAYPKYTIVP